MLEFSPIPGTRCQLGESPVWDDEIQALLWCDIPAGKIYELSIAGGEIGAGRRREWAFEGPVGSFGLGIDGRLIVACGRAVLRLDRDTGAVSPLAAVETNEATRLNDGKVGPDGAFWVGSMDDTPAKQGIGSLFRIGPAGGVERKFGNIVTSNGLAWSPDGSAMFHADTRGPTLDRWRFDPETGNIAAPIRLATMTNEQGRPDGGATDQAGIYWSAGVTAGRLNLFHHQDGLVGHHPFPVAAPTMPCFGGSDFRTLFVTSARRDEAAADSGSIFHARVEIPGVPIHRFLF